MRHFTLIHLPALALLGRLVEAAVDVHGLIPIGQATESAAPATASDEVFQGTHTYDNTQLNTPPYPDPINLAPFLQLQTNTDTVPVISIPQKPGFLGFSIEMSVLTQLMGSSSEFIKVPFLNLLANIEKRAGATRIRVGGNTQEKASYREELPGGVSMDKEKRPDSNVTTETPDVLYTDEMFHMMAAISSLVHVEWYLGIPFNQTLQTGGFRLDMIHRAEAILGDAVLGFQAGNEPDLYVATSKHREAPYGSEDYMGEFADLIGVLATDDQVPRKNILIGPSTAHPYPAEFIDPLTAQFVSRFQNDLAIVSVETYPENNCEAQFDPDPSQWKIPQDELFRYISHTSVQELVNPYQAFVKTAVDANKPFWMFETNTASCGGFAGISNTMVSALWTLDYAMQMASQNFTGALLHVGGQSTYYNPFTAPPTNQAKFHQWTIGPIFYSVIAMAEAFGSSNTSRVVDMTEVDTAPAYAIYENGVPARLALINYLNDASGAHDTTFTFAIGGSGVEQPDGTPSSVKVKYLSASSFMSRGDITWAGQGFGEKLSSDGIIRGDLDIVEIQCNQADNTCNIPLKAPQFALVFLNNEAFSESNDDSQAFTFATTAQTDTKNTATVDPAVLATSNGQSGKDRTNLAGTSKSESSGMGLKDLLPCLSLLIALVAGGSMVLLPTMRS